MLSGNKGQKQANRHLEQIGQQGREFYNPYIQRGQEAQGQLNPMYEQMSQDPQAFLDNILGSYQQSQGFQRQQQNALQAGNNSAAAGGFAGTMQHRNDQMDLARAMQGEDMDKFLQQILGIQGAGMGALQGQADRGYESGGSLMDLLSGMRGSQAGLAYQGGANRNNRMQYGLAGLGQGLGQLGGAMNWQNLGDMFR